MLGLIVKITEPRASRAGSYHQLVIFKDMLTGQYLPMCLPHSADILKNWDGALQRGAVLDDLNVVLRGKTPMVDAKSRPHLVTHIDLHNRRCNA